MTFLAILTYGAVAVPILHEFTPDQVHNIVNHSDAKLLFIGDVVGSPGRKLVSQLLPRLIPRWGLGLVVCNAENSAGGCSNAGSRWNSASATCQRQAQNAPEVAAARNCLSPNSMASASSRLSPQAATTGP